MELNKVTLLLEKYFEGETSLSEEKELKAYFASTDVAQHLEQYRPMFGYFAAASGQTAQRPLVLKEQKRSRAWLSVAASAVILLGAGTYTYFNSNNATAQSEELGTYRDPEVAFRETQKALKLLSGHVNTGVESMGYLQEYQQSKNVIFKK